MRPEISVIMSVYNGEDYLPECIESILNQSFRDFEFVIINDGSKDNSLEIIQSYSKADARIVLISRGNKGLIASLNEGIAQAKGKFIARMDADDISVKNRLELQRDFLLKNEKVGVVSTNIQYFNKFNRRDWPFFFETHKEMMSLISFRSPLIHGTVMIRSELLNKTSYDRLFEHAEDYDLWSRLILKTEFATLKKVLYLHREHDEKVSVKHNEVQINNSLQVAKNYLNRNGVSVWDENLHKQILTTYYRPNEMDLELFLVYINAIKEQLGSEKSVMDWLKSIFIINNTNIPKWFYFKLLKSERGVLPYLSVKQKLSLLMRSVF